MLDEYEKELVKEILSEVEAEDEDFQKRVKRILCIINILLKKPENG